MIAETAALLSSFKALSDIATAMLGIRDAVQVNTKAIELQSAIITAQQQAIAIQQEYFAVETKARNLEAECMRLKDWSSEKQKYVIREIAAGVFAYVQNDIVNNFQEAHKYCCNCFESGQKSILQQSKNFEIYLSCQSCKSHLKFSHYLVAQTMIAG